MYIIQSIILGIIQGATEFIPVSSSGHLVLIRQFLGWEDPGLSFDIALHFGTLIAVVFYFRKLWQKIFQDLRYENIRGNRLAWGIIIATVPAIVVGYFGKGLIVKYFRSGLSVGIGMIIVGILFVLIEKFRSRAAAAQSKEVLAWWDYLIVGIAQSIALIPGVSRSGITIVGGMGRRMSRREAAEFSFLLAAPAILGAVIYDFLINYKALDIDYFQAAIGFLISLVIGYISIRFLISYLTRRKLNAFAYYLFLIGAGAVVFSLWRGA